MQKSLLIALIIAFFPFLTRSESGMLQTFIEEKKESLKVGTTEAPFAVGAALLGLAAITVQEYQKSQQPITTRGMSVGIPFLPLLYAGLGASCMGFLVYRFIGYEMGLIIQSQKTLKSLEKDIHAWQKLLPQLQQNQADIAKKLQNALKVLDTITPLVGKLATQDELDPRVDILQKQIYDLKNLVSQLSTLQNKPEQQALFSQTVQSLVNTSEKVFGKK